MRYDTTNYGNGKAAGERAAAEFAAEVLVDDSEKHKRLDRSRIEVVQD